MTSIAAEVPVVEVTLLEDRAHVVRRGRVHVDAGVTKLTVAGAAAVLCDKTLVARLDCAPEQARVIDARVRRERIERADDDADDGSYDNLRQKLETLDEDTDKLDAARRALERRTDALDELARLALDEIADDARWGVAPTAADNAQLEALSVERRAQRTELLELRAEVAVAREKRQRLATRLESLKQPGHVMRTALEIEVLAEAAGDRELTIDYVVPNACWRPYHSATLRTHDGGHRIALSTDACVWQNTGEPWTNVSLSFSTQRASLGVDPPELESDELSLRRRREVLQVDTREQRVEAVTAGEPQPLDELPGIDDGGDSITLVAPARIDVPSDGRPQRVALTSFESDATLELTTHPELMSGVVTKATLHNAGAGPLLAGPVDMIRDGGLSCRSALLYVGRGERFDLSFGTEPELRVSRTIEVEHEEGGRLSSWTRLLHHIEIRLSNLGPDRREVSIRERVPVSEVEKVKIVPDPKGTTNHQTPDEDGFVDWDVTLDPFDTATIALRYRIEKHADVIGL